MAGRNPGQERDQQVSLRLLIDTNIFLAAEPYSGFLESEIENSTELIRLAQEYRHQVLVHPATRDDLLENVDPARKAQRLAEFNRYVLLVHEPPISVALQGVAGASEPGSNDHRDLRLLAALHAHAVTHLVTNDRRLRKRANRAGLGDSVYTAQEALQHLRQLVPVESPPPPLVTRIPAYALDGDQQIFESLRSDYPDFDKWFDQVRAESEHRPCFLVTSGDSYAGLALLKHESACEYPLPQPVVKISTFKVDPDQSGFKYGELLLKSIFAFGHRQRTASMYVTMFDRHEPLRALFEEFGFEEQADLRTDLGELVMAKRLRSNRDESLAPLQYHKTYGPPAILFRRPAWAIPIEPRWHKQLFPDAPGEDLQPPLPGMANIDSKPWGNALRKAYLCLSPVTKLGTGDVIAFYRSRDLRAVTVVGVVEATLRSPDPIDIVAFVGKRTVYTPADIATMSQRGRLILAILFRQDRFVDPPWRLEELIRRKLLKSHPQSVTEFRAEGVPWLQQQLAEWP